MPIRPENRGRYPADWPAIAHAVKQRAGWRCECQGECGRGHLGRCPERHYSYSLLGDPNTWIVLTAAHLNHTPEDCDPDNLRAWCQGCHLHHDIDHHAQTRREREDRERVESGQLVLQLSTTLTNPAPDVRGSSNGLTRRAA